MINVAKKKMGRPIVGQPKDIRLTIRIDEDSYAKLVAKSKELSISQSEVVRMLLKEMQ